MMTGPEVDLFSKRLMGELDALSWKDRNELLIRIGRMELRMRSSGQERPLWKGPIPQDKILGSDVVVSTEQGERRGRVICFGVQQSPMSLEYELSVIVLVPSSGTHHEAPASTARLVGPNDVERMAAEMEMARRLRQTDESLQSGATPIEGPVRPKRRGEKDPALVKKMLEAANGHVNVKTVDEGSSNYKIVGVDPDRRLYLFKNQLRVDVSGFEIDHPGVRKISEQEAKDMHLGKVRGQLLFESKQVAYEGFIASLERLDGR